MSAKLHPKTRAGLIEDLIDIRGELARIDKSKPTTECVFLRIQEVSVRLQLNGYSEHVALAAADSAGKAAFEVVEHGAGPVWESKERGGWFWAIAATRARWLAMREIYYGSLDNCDLPDDTNQERIAVLVVALWEAIPRLPPRERDVLVCLLNGELQTTIAEKLGVAVCTVSRRLWRARERLRPMLEPMLRAQCES